MTAIDRKNTVPVAAFKENMQMIVASCITTGDFILVNESSGGKEYAIYQAEYRLAILELVRENSCQYYDENARSISQIHRAGLPTTSTRRTFLMQEQREHCCHFCYPALE